MSRGQSISNCNNSNKKKGNLCALMLDKNENIETGMGAAF